MFIGPYASEAQFTDRFLNISDRPNPKDICLAIIRKTRTGSAADPDGELAGLVACMDASSNSQIVSIGYPVVFPAFRSSAMIANVMDLLLHCFLDSPFEGGLGFERAEVVIAEQNRRAGISLQHLGFRRRGYWRAGDGEGVSRGVTGTVGTDTVCFAMDWGEWQQDGRDKIASRVHHKTATYESRL